MLAEALRLALQGLAIVAAMMFALWLVHLLIRNAAIVDVGWATALATLAIFYAVEGPGYSARKWTLAAMAGFLGLRPAGCFCFCRGWGQTGGRADTPGCERKESRPCRCASCFSLSFRRF